MDWRRRELKQAAKSKSWRRMGMMGDDGASRGAQTAFVQSLGTDAGR
jgi:hypothetical protein